MLNNFHTRWNSASILSWFATAAAPWRKFVDRNDRSIRPIFAGVWKQSGGEVCIVLAQAPALSGRYRRLFLSEAARLVVPQVGVELRAAAERQAAVGSTRSGGALGSINVFVQFDGGLVVGIEEENPTCLDRQAHLRYEEYLQLRNSDPILMLIMPNTDDVLNEEAAKLDRFVSVNCEQLVGWADGCLVDWLNHTTPKIETVLGNLKRPLAAMTMRSERQQPDVVHCSCG
jgi:hypothetical protein